MEFAFAPSLSLARRTAGLALRRHSARPPTPLHSAPVPRHAVVRIICTTAEPRAASTSSPSPPTQIPIGKRMSSADIRDAFLSFYQSRGHARLPSASLVPDDPTIMLTIAGMVPFKPIFLGAAARPENPRATTSQKCIRTNDIENVGVTKRHHTFFEMLGNFSFGDYFKPDAIAWAWKLLTEVYEIPPQRLAVSVYEEDEDALAIWRDQVGVPVHRIKRMGAADNFWASGPTGPCGPCSEIYFDFDPASAEPIDLEDDERFIELYNLVFMQYSRDVNGELSPLAAQNIDTGMGLERMAQVLQQVETNYETDLILPIIDAVADIAGICFADASLEMQTSLKVVGDHLRAAAHLVADGVRPSNVGRGYIVRRLIRRIVRHGRLLGIEGRFTADLIPVVAKLADEGGLSAIKNNIKEVTAEIEREEERFLVTLERGEERLEQVLKHARSRNKTVIPGADAFELYDTFGFPLELTEEIATEYGLTVEKQDFEACMDQQRTRARAARDTDSLDVAGNAMLSEAAATFGPTSFSGYDDISPTKCTVVALFADKSSRKVDEAREGEIVRVLLEESPFYAEGGGQVGDTGLLTGPRGAVRIDDTRKEAGAYVHVGEVVSGQVSVGELVQAEVNAALRRRIKAHHTATHLLQAALKKVIPEGGISQAGSLVNADRLRFDFSCSRPVSAKELQSVENLINTWIAEAHDTSVSHMSLDEAKDAGAVAMFGEKYDASKVRVVDVPGVAMELCGGTHVQNTSEIGLFKVISESGPSSGVRRIEALCGAAVMPYLTVRDAAVKALSTALKARPEELPSRVSAIQEELRARSKELELVKAELAITKALGLAEEAKRIRGGSYLVAELDAGISSDSLKAAAESLATRLGASAMVLLASVNNGKVSFVAAVGKDLQKKGIAAGKLVGQVAKVCGGGGGGRPNLAQAGGRDPSKLEEALELGRAIVQQALQG